MTRIASSANATELARPDIQIAIAADMDFSSGHVRVNDSASSVTISGNVYTGIGQFGSIEPIEEQVDVIARPLKLILSGVDASIVAIARDEVYQNRSVTVYLCVLNRDTQQLIDTPEVAWEGRMDTMLISLAGEQSRIELNCEHRLRREPRIARYTDADEQMAYSGDRFFDLLGKIQGFRGTWGAKGVANDGRTIVTTPKYPGGFRFNLDS